jgi:hypothetical protein
MRRPIAWVAMAALLAFAGSGQGERAIQDRPDLRVGEAPKALLDRWERQARRRPLVRKARGRDGSLGFPKGCGAQKTSRVPRDRKAQG